MGQMARRLLLSCSLALLLGGCLELGTSAPGEIEIGQLLVAPRAAQVQMQIKLGPAYYAAIQSGVPITLVWQLEALEPGMIWSRTLWKRSGQRVIGYRSLRGHYTLDDGLGLQRHSSDVGLEKALETLLLSEPLPTLAADQQLRFRLRLDADALPPPMRLPARINPIWWLDSDWRTLTVNASAGRRPSV